MKLQSGRFIFSARPLTMTPATAIGDMLPAWVPLATMTAIGEAGIFVCEASIMHGAAIRAQIVMAGPERRQRESHQAAGWIIATLPRTPLTA